MVEMLILFSTIEDTDFYPEMHYQFNTDEAYLAIQNGQLPIVREIDELEYSRVFDQPQVLSNRIWTDSMFFKLQESALLDMGITRPIMINSANYLVPCENFMNGAIQTKYHSSSYWFEKNGYHLSDLEISINIGKGIILINFTDNNPIFFFDRSITYLDWQNFDYLDVIQIAEENGGSKVREQKNNNCEIEINSYTSTNNFWQVSYDGPGVNLNMDIEPETLEVIYYPD